VLNFLIFCVEVLQLKILLGCIECMRCWLFLSMFAVSVSLLVCLSRSLTWRWHVQCMPHAVCAGSFGAAFTKCLWPLVFCRSLRLRDAPVIWLCSIQVQCSHTGNILFLVNVFVVERCGTFGLWPFLCLIHWHEFWWTEVTFYQFYCVCMDCCKSDVLCLTRPVYWSVNSNC